MATSPVALFTLLTAKTMFSLESKNWKCSLKLSKIFASALVQVMNMFCKSITQIPTT